MSISETFLDSRLLYDDPRLRLAGYNSVTTDNADNTKIGGVVFISKNRSPFVRQYPPI